MKFTKLSKFSAVLSAAALLAGMTTSLVYAEESTLVTERYYVDKAVKLSGGQLEIDSEYIALNWNTTGILSFDLGGTGNVQEVKLGIAKWYGENTLYEYGINGVSYDNYKMNASDYDTWNNFLPQQSTNLSTLTSTRSALNNYDEIDITDCVADVNNLRYLSIRLRNAGGVNQSVIWADNLAFKPYIEVTRDTSADAQDFVDAINSSNDEISAQMAIENYAKSTGLDYERYCMIDYADIFAKEFASVEYASFAELKTAFNTLLDKYVPETEVQCEFFSGMNVNEFNCLGKATDSRTVKNANSNTVLFGYKTNAVNPETLKGVRVRFKQATNNTTPYKMGFMLKYILSDTYPELKYGGRDSESFQNWKTFLTNETPINKKIDISESAGDVFYADMPELVSLLSENAGKELVLHATIPTGEQRDRNNFNLYMDSAIILYHDVSASFVSLQNILDGVATAEDIKAWAEEFGANYNIDINSLYDMNGVYAELVGKTFKNVEDLVDGFEKAIESKYAVLYINTSDDVTRADGGSGFVFNKTSLVVGNGNGWNMVINSFKIPASEYVKSISYVATYGWTYGAGQKILLKKYSTTPIPQIPDSELSSNGDKLTEGAIYDAWNQYFNTMKTSTFVHTLEEAKAIGESSEFELPEDIVKEVQKGATQLSLAVSGSDGLQMNSAYNTSSKVPSQLKVTYDKTVFEHNLVEAVNNAENENDVIDALDNFSIALSDEIGYDTFGNGKKALVAKDIYGKQYQNVTEIEEVIKAFDSKFDGEKFVIAQADDNDGTVSATIINVSGVTTAPVVIAAYYNNNALAKAITYSENDLPQESFEEKTITVGEYDGTYDRVKVFVFKSLNLIEPWAKSYTID